MSVVSLEMAINSVCGANVISIVQNRSGDRKNGMPPHSVRITVDGGDDQDIARAIYEVTSPSLYLVGEVCVSMPPHGYVMRFSRPNAEQPDKEETCPRI